MNFWSVFWNYAAPPMGRSLLDFLDDVGASYLYTSGPNISDLHDPQFAWLMRGQKFSRQTVRHWRDETNPTEWKIQIQTSAGRSRWIGTPTSIDPRPATPDGGRPHVSGSLHTGALRQPDRLLPRDDDRSASASSSATRCRHRRLSLEWPA